MAQETKVEETRCSLQTFERNRYFYGKPMTVSDFEAEQRYLMGKQRYINRLVHGAGVLCGLQVTLPVSFSALRPTVEVAEGAALDCCGNLIVVSRSSTVEVKEEFNPEGVNYLYIKYAECSKQPVMLAANGSSCEEVCCYNRIQETFEIVASGTAPGGATTTPPSGGAAVAPPSKDVVSKKVSADETVTDPKTLCRELTESYFQEHLRTCPGCDNPLVFLAVLDMTKGEVDEAETAKYRSVVYNNSMLHELLCDHVTDRNNPHETSAAQVLALQSVNGVGNGAGKSFVANINLDSSSKTIEVEAKVNDLKIDLGLATDAVKMSHLNVDVCKKLIQPSATINVEPNTGKKIVLNTIPAKTVSSVGGVKVVGTSGNYAPEDHAHDLAAGVVERKHLGRDVYANLIQGGGIIKVEPDAAAQTIKISAEVDVAAPGDDLKQVTSVRGAKQVGKSERYAREDHAHDLYINGHSPNESGQFLLTAGANVSIEKGKEDNELVISAEGGSRTVIATGFFIFENVLPQEARTSTLIAHRLDAELVAVIVAEEVQEGLHDAEGGRLNALDANAKFGDVTAFLNEAPFLMAEVDYGQKTIQISLKDRRLGTKREPAVIEEGGGFKFIATKTFDQPGETESSAAKEPSGFIPPTGISPSGTGGDIILEPDARTYRIRWWAIPA